MLEPEPGNPFVFSKFPPQIQVHIDGSLARPGPGPGDRRIRVTTTSESPPYPSQCRIRLGVTTPASFDSPPHPSHRHIRVTSVADASERLRPCAGSSGRAAADGHRCRRAGGATFKFGSRVPVAGRDSRARDSCAARVRVSACAGETGGTLARSLARWATSHPGHYQKGK